MATQPKSRTTSQAARNRRQAVEDARDLAEMQRVKAESNPEDYKSHAEVREMVRKQREERDRISE
jgi:hypothetical protein